MFKKILTRPNILYRLMLVLISISLAACSNSSLPQSATLETSVASIPAQTPTSTVASFITARSAAYILQVSGLESDSTETSISSGFVLTSPDVVEGGALPTEYTCDGASATLALTWSSAPEETAGYAVIMHHIASPEDIHWYWVLYDIPVDVTSLPKNITRIGTLGNNSVNGDTAYAPPCSKGPGEKVYTYTVYALSAQPLLSVPASEVTRTVLLEAIRDITLASAELNVTYTRK
jgi:phosphatidylethanolamine-binding protein (PEBP) family uncharacterized protein